MKTIHNELICSRPRIFTAGGTSKRKKERGFRPELMSETQDTSEVKQQLYIILFFFAEPAFSYTLLFLFVIPFAVLIRGFFKKRKDIILERSVCELISLTLLILAGVFHRRRCIHPGNLLLNCLCQTFLLHPGSDSTNIAINSLRLGLISLIRVELGSIY